MRLIDADRLLKLTSDVFIILMATQEMSNEAGNATVASFATFADMISKAKTIDVEDIMPKTDKD